MANKEIEN